MDHHHVQYLINYIFLYFARRFISKASYSISDSTAKIVDKSELVIKINEYDFADADLFPLFYFVKGSSCATP